VNTFEHPNNLTIKEKELDEVKASMIHIFPPHSVSILELYGQ
jgi:alpha-L-arabinofuranosidase